MKTIYKKYDKGMFLISADEIGITKLEFIHETMKESNAEEYTPILLKAAIQLGEYFAGERRIFDLPLHAEGTEFQRKVWEALREIPYGETRSYKQIANAVGNPKGSRAIGMANNRNPIMIVTPCHRVIGANGKLVGYAGGLDMKSYLLDLEKEHR